MTISYAKDQNQIYLDEIEYAGHASALPTNLVKFYLEDTRPDAGPMYQAHMETVTAYRLKTVEMQANGYTVRAYGFTYSETTDASRSRLASVQQYGNDAVVDVDGDISSGTSFPPISMTYSDSVIGGAEDFWGEDDDVYLPAGGSGGGYADWDGDGVTDVILITPIQVMILKSNDGVIEEHNVYKDSNGLCPGAIGEFGDFNGDGKADYAYFYASYDNITVIESTGLRGVPSDWGGKSQPVEPNVYGVGDFNGDGFDDIMYRQKRGYGSNFYVLASDGDSFTEEHWADEGMEADCTFWGVGDFNGDGLSDWGYVNYKEDLKIMLSNGSEFSGPSKWLRISDYWPSVGYCNPQRLGFGDFNGDGLTDYCFGGFTTAFLPYGSQGSGSTTLPTISYYVALSTGSGFEMAQWGAIDHETYGYATFSGLGDFNGDGRTDLLFSTIEGGVVTLLSNGFSFQTVAWPGTIHGAAGGAMMSSASYRRYGIANAVRVGAYGGGGAAPTPAGLGDFNGDGKTDLIYTQNPRLDLSEMWFGSSEAF